MDDNTKPSFSSLEEKCLYYIEKYETYKLKFISLNTEYERLLENNKKLYENINNERKLRKELEEKLKYTNFTSNNCISNDNNNKSKKEDNFQDELIMLEKNIDPEEEELLNIKEEFKIKHMEIINIINFSILPKNKIIIEKEKKNGDNTKINQINKNNLNINNHSNNKPSKTLITEEIIKQGFIMYSKESISLSNSINENELKIDKMYFFIQKFRKHLNILKCGAKFFNKSIALFNKNLSIYNTENEKVLESWPFLTEFISLIQKSFSTINIYCSSLITTIDSSCLIQINDIITKQFKNLNNRRNKVKTKKEEYNSFKIRFLSNKNYEAMKSEYYKEYSEYELSKYDYFSTINRFLMLIKLKLPEILSLLIYSYFVYFSTVKNELDQINDTVRINLESLLSASNIKNKIDSDIKNNRKSIVDNNKIFDKTKKEKEGFLYLKEKDGSKFNKRYIKISKGYLIYYKLKKGIKTNFEYLDNKIYTNILDSVDTDTSFEICKLLLANVKKYEKKYYYPFCFEVHSANTKTGYIFQAETEYEMEEWISAITNAISGQISDFNEYKSNNDNKTIKEINNKISEDEDEKSLLGIKYKSAIKVLIEDNICADCGAINPTWFDINWLVLLCVDCSGIHRSLGVQISKIKSLELDNINNDYVDLLFMLKQSEINNILEEKLSQNEEQKPKCTSSREEKEKFIINKYKDKKYMNYSQINEENIIKIIFDNIKGNNFINNFKLIKLNKVDVNCIYLYEGEEWGFVHYSAKCGKIFFIKLFYILGADVNLKDKKGLKPIDYINREEQNQIYEYLKDKEK